ncbi:MAG: type IV pili twitching motility protein PilT, partial [Lachnospiraceae bacterium]|nr:type IV pili twitching motility protein PilT [Lachnospiraceae bacterium]
MITIQGLLEKAAEMRGSDLHLSVGAPLQVRIYGELKAIEGSRLTPEDMHDLVYSILPAKLVPRFEEQGEVDFSYSIPSIGRYRANLY